MMPTRLITEHHLDRNAKRALIVALAIVSCAAGRALSEEVTIKHSDLTLNANLESPESEQSASQVILILHGLLGHNQGAIVRTFQAGFLKNGWTSLAPNLSLGIGDRHGNFDCATPHRYRLIDAVDELGAWMTWLKARGVRRVILVGHSLAANQVMAFASARGDPSIAGIILLAPSTQGYKRVVSIYETRYGVELEPLLSRARELVGNGQGDTLLKPVDFIFCPQTAVGAASFFDYYGEGNSVRDLPAMLQKVETPIMIIAASKDDRQPDLIERVTPFVDDKRVYLSIVDGAGHFFRDLFDDKALDYAVDFINALK